MNKYEEEYANIIESSNDETFCTPYVYDNKLSEDFIRKYQDKLCFVEISEHQTLSEGFIEEFAHKVNWNYISIRQKLSQNFIRKFCSEVNWYQICRHQKLSYKFIKEFSNEIYFKYIPICCLNIKNEYSWATFL